MKHVWFLWLLARLHSLFQALGQWGRSKKRAGDKRDLRRAGSGTPLPRVPLYCQRAWNRLTAAHLDARSSVVFWVNFSGISALFYGSRSLYSHGLWLRRLWQWLCNMIKRSRLFFCFVLFFLFILYFLFFFVARENDYAIWSFQEP